MNYLLPRHAMQLNTAPMQNALAGYRQGMNQHAQFERQGDWRQQDLDWRQGQAERQQGNADRNYLLARERLDLAKQPKPPQMPWYVQKDGSLHPAAAAYRAAGRPVTNVNVNATQEKAYDKEIGKQNAKYFIEGQKGGATARRDLNNLRVMKKALDNPNLFTGTGGKTIQSLKKTAQTLFGVPIKGVADGEIVENLSKTIAVGLKENLPGPLSDSDRRFLVEMAPGLSNSPEGNRRIIGLGMLQKEYQIARATAANEYARANGGRLDQGFGQYLARVEDEYAQKFAGMIATMRQQGEVAPRPPTAGIPQITTPQAFQQLPSGSKFQAPDGSIRIKP